MQGLNYLSCNCHGGDEDSLYPKGREEGLQVAREPEWHDWGRLQYLVEIDVRGHWDCCMWQLCKAGSSLDSQNGTATVH